MYKRRAIVLIGTKAQFIKTAPILSALDDQAIPYELIYTGQHSETFDLLERAFGTRPADLILVPEMEASTKRSFISWTAKFILNVRREIKGWKFAPWGLIHGDTASTLFSAIALKLAGVRVVHVEAGLRSPRMFDPFPEEVIRRLVSMLTSLHLAPDAVAAANLDGTAGLVIDTDGNTMRDALLMALSQLGTVPEYGGEGGYAVVSIHRSENLGSKATFDFLMEQVLRIAEKTNAVFVLHPATREKIRSTGWLEKLESVSRLTLLERMDYPDFVKLLLSSSFLMTDGGSNQEEAAMLGLPTLVMRNETERPDGLGDNVVLSKLQANLIDGFVNRHVGQKWAVRMVGGTSPSKKIAAILADY